MKEQNKNTKKQDEGLMDEGGCAMSAHLLIRDKESGEVLVKKRG